MPMVFPLLHFLLLFPLVSVLPDRLLLFVMGFCFSEHICYIHKLCYLSAFCIRGISIPEGFFVGLIDGRGRVSFCRQRCERERKGLGLRGAFGPVRAVSKYVFVFFLSRSFFFFFFFNAGLLYEFFIL